EATRLLNQITGLDEVRCGQISHDTSGAALFDVLRAPGCSSQDGLKVLIHATSHDKARSEALGTFARLPRTASADAMAYLMSSCRGEMKLLDLGMPEYRAIAQGCRRTARPAEGDVRYSEIERSIEALGRTMVRRGG